MQQLDEIGFVWDPYTADWEEGFATLEVFKKREGHCRVPTAHKEGDYKLGQWVSTQRNKSTLAPERLQRLNEIGFVWDARKPGLNLLELSRRRLRSHWQKTERKLIKPKVYQKTYQSDFLFHNYDYKSDIYKILMAEGEGFEPSKGLHP